ncbi:MAG: GntR family transcriptional regulator [Chitinophagaceae bacterium]|jgi:DNA-binding transcriptional regulator YhcF (GntR family)|nr:GntR family transcriptional regulator [Chitinophagaceae bacterium]
MASENIYTLIHLDDYSVTPKYLQLANSILKGIEAQKLEQGYILPSINNLSFEMDISRNTVEKAYKYLKKNGIINSFPGKGYVIDKIDVGAPTRVFMLFNKLSVHKKMIYDSFVKALGQNAIIDLYIYNNDFSLFKKLLTEKKEDYSYYIIIPHFLEGGENAHEMINATVPKENLILMSQLLSGVDGHYGAVYENYEEDIYHALVEALERLKKYHALNIVFPEYTYHPHSILNGFIRFCQDYAFEYGIIRKPNAVTITEGVVYISLMEDDLVVIIKKILASKLVVGKQVGIISYNETPMKEIILNGITTISADFKMMGECAAKMILEKSVQHVAAPFYLTLRSSL